MQTAEELLAKYQQITAQYQKNKEEKEDLEKKYDKIKEQIAQMENADFKDDKTKFLVKIFMVVLAGLMAFSGSEMIFLLVKGMFSDSFIFAIILTFCWTTFKYDLAYLEEHKQDNKVNESISKLKEDEESLKEELTKKYSLCDNLEKEANDYYRQYERLISGKEANVTTEPELLPISNLVRTRSITK